MKGGFRAEPDISDFYHTESSPGFQNMTTKSQVILKSNKKMCHLL